MGVITLLTDFGHRDGYVGVMKGVIATISPDCQVIDITHDIFPQAIWAARFNLLTSYSYFPAGTIHVVVVDPGVGTQRSAVAFQVASSNGVQTVIAPDNGLITGLPIIAAVRLTESRYWRTRHPSHTFHGRDIFAPVAAHLANGVAFSALGSSMPIASLVSLPIAEAVSIRQGYSGSVQYIDHFGNLVTTIVADRLTGERWQVQLCDARGESLRDCKIDGQTTYGHVAMGTAVALVGSHGYVEVAVNCGSAAQLFQAQVGDAVELHYL